MDSTKQYEAVVRFGHTITPEDPLVCAIPWIRKDGMPVMPPSVDDVRAAGVQNYWTGVAAAAGVQRVEGRRPMRLRPGEALPPRSISPPGSSTSTTSKC